MVPRGRDTPRGRVACQQAQMGIDQFAPASCVAHTSGPDEKTVMPEGTEVAHHNHILLPSQQVYDGEIPQAPEPNASSSQARGHRSGDSTPHKAAPPRPPSSSTSSGNRSERAWASEDGGEQRGEHDRTELMQRTSPHPSGELIPSEPSRRTAAAAPRSGASEEPEHMTSNSSHRKRGQPTPGQQPPQHAPAIEHPLFGAPSTQTQEEMLAVAQLVEEGQASRVAWTGGRNPCQDAHEATVPDTTPPTQQQRGHSPGSPTRKRSKTGTSQQQPEPEPGDAAASNAQEGMQSNTAAPQHPHLEHHRPAARFPQLHTLGQSHTAAGSQQQHLEHHQPSTFPQQSRDQQQQESSAYMILRAQQLVAQLMPTLVGDQVPLAAEALGQLQSWTRGIWGHDIQLVADSATDSCGSMADTVPWHPPEPMRGPEEGSGMPRPTRNEELWAEQGARTH